MVIYRLRSIGEVYVPSVVAGGVEPDAPIRMFGPGDLASAARAFGCIRRGGLAVLSGPWERLLSLLQYAEKHRSELGRENGMPRTASLPRRGARSWEKQRLRTLMRLLVVADGERLQGVEPEMRFPHLLELLGEPAGSHAGLPFLIPLLELRTLAADLRQGHYVRELDADVFSPGGVLAPLSQESVTLMGEALAAVRENIPSGARLLDMGSGSGCLTLLAALRLAGRLSRIVATDALPEALAATRINVERFVQAGRIPEDLIEVTRGGDLFEPLPEDVFDVIVFNAPWIVSPARSRSERSTHDQDQAILARFLSTAARHLHASGRVLLQYSDHSGPRAMQGLTELIERHAWRVQKQWRVRIQARRRNPKWENVFVFDLRRST